jgi:IclR family KDG regulon transcriptional repressor
VGRRLPPHCTALGKVLLACSDERTRERYYREHVAAGGLRAHTPKTISDRDKFFEHLSMVAAQGSALDIEECEIGLCCAAAPVFDGDGQLRAALSISGPRFRLDPDVLVREAVPAVVEAADRLSEMLGRPT